MVAALFAALFAAFLAGCAGSATQVAATGQAAAPVVVKLDATPYNAGAVGEARLSPADGGTQILLSFSGVPPSTTKPVHVYTYIYDGQCRDLPAKPVHSLNRRVLVTTPSGQSAYSSRGAFSLSHTAAVPIEELLSGRFALGLRTAPADGDDLIYCGDLGKK